jgi:hypothetical protein
VVSVGECHVLSVLSLSELYFGTDVILHCGIDVTLTWQTHAASSLDFESGRLYLGSAACSLDPTHVCEVR